MANSQFFAGDYHHYQHKIAEEKQRTSLAKLALERETKLAEKRAKQKAKEKARQEAKKRSISR